MYIYTNTYIIYIYIICIYITHPHPYPLPNLHAHADADAHAPAGNAFETTCGTHADVHVKQRQMKLTLEPCAIIEYIYMYIYT